MPRERVYIIYDFNIEEGLGDQLEYVKGNPPDGFDVDYPSKAGKSQGEIWRGIVKPELDRARRVIAFVDRPNANVGFEVGYALGSEADTKVALATIKDGIPDWLSQPPFKGYSVKPLPGDDDLIEQIRSGDWINVSPDIKKGNEILLLCPEGLGKRYLRTAENVRKWKILERDGWSLQDLPSQLNGAGAVVWLVLPHRQGKEARDGMENTAMSIIAGFAEARGLPVHVLVHKESRVVVDVLSRSLDFTGIKDLPEILTRAVEVIEELFEPITEAGLTAQAKPQFERPSVGSPPTMDFRTVLEKRFVGRESQLRDVEDALRGLGARARGERATGGARVQVAWYDGFGGMGKSWFLRRAMVTASKILPKAKIGLIDWDSTAWRDPLTQPPETPEQLYLPIVYRLVQLYGVAAMDPFWRAQQRVKKARPVRAELRKKFEEEVDQLRIGEEVSSALRSVLRNQGLWATGGELKQKLELLEMDPELRGRTFRRWVDESGGTFQDAEGTLNPDALLSTALVTATKSVTQTAPLMLVFDTCELLSEDMDRWLRQFVVPLCDGSTPALALFGSRLAPDVAIPAGSRAGWRAEIGEGRWRHSPFDEGVRFTVAEVQLALEGIKNPPHKIDSVAEALHRISLGVPLALRSMLDLHEEGDPILNELQGINEVDESLGIVLDEQRAEQVVVEQISARFLLHLSNRHDRRKDLEDIIALSLLRKANSDILSEFWSGQNVRSRLRELSKRYSLLAVGDLHSTVRAFLRRRWRMEEREEVVDEIIDRLETVFSKLPTPGNPGDSRYMEAVADKLNMQAWSNEAAALTKFAPAIAIALAYDELSETLIELAAEIKPDQERETEVKMLRKLHQRSGELWRWRPAWIDAEFLAWLRKHERRGQWSPFEKACLDVLEGLSESNVEHYENALRHLTSAVSHFDGNVPRGQSVGAALFTIGYSLGDSVEKVQMAADAYDAAIRVGYSESAVWNNRGVSLRRLDRNEEAEAHLMKAAELEPNEPLYPYNLGDMYRDLKRYEEAETWYGKALEVDPDYGYAHNSLGLLRKAQDQVEKAEAAFKRAMEADPKEPLYPYNLGDMYRDLKRYEEAETWYGKALEVDPDYGYAHNGLGLLRKAQDQVEKAEAAFKRAMEADPKEPLYPRNLGDMYRDLKRYEEAETWYGKALEVDPDYGYAHNSLGLLRKAQDQVEKAEAAFKRAMEADPKEPLYPYNLGDMYRDLKRYEEAETWYGKALEVDPDYGYAHNGLGLLRKAQDQVEKAEAAFKRAMEADPKEPIYPRNLGDMYLDLKRYEEAETWYGKALEVDPDYGSAHNSLGLLRKAQDQVEKAEAAFKRAMEADPKEPLYPRNLGDMYRDLKRYEEAETWYGKALEVDPDYGSAHNSLGLLRKAQDQVEKTEAAFKRAMEADPKEPIYPYNLGDMYRDLKRYEEAETWYGKALEVDPDYGYAHNSLGLLRKAQDQVEKAEAAFKRAMEADPKEPLYPYNLGDMYRDLKRYEEAETWYGKALEVDPDYGYAHNGLGLLRKAQDQVEKAEAAFKRAMEADPKEPIYPRNLGDMYLDLKRYEEAETWYGKALEVDPDYGYAHNSLGLLRKAQDQVEKAEAAFKRAMEADPKEPLYPYNLGDMYRDLKRYEEAETWYGKALEVDPDYGYAHNSLGLLRKAQDQVEKAEAAFKRAMEADPKEPLYPRNLGDMYRDLKRYEEAETWYGKALEVDPDYGSAHNSLGLLRKAQDQVEKAEAAFKRAMEADPKEPLYPRNLGDMYRDLKRYEEAETWYGKALEVDPDYGYAHNSLGLLRKAQDQVEKAEAAFKRAMEADPKEPLYPRNLGDMYRDLKRYEEAETWYGKALEVDPDYGYAHNSLGLLRKAQDQVEKAEAAFKRAMEADPKEPIYPYNLGDMYRDLKRYEEAETWYGKALEVDPDYGSAHNSLGLLRKAQDQVEKAEAAFKRAMEADPKEPIYPYNLGDMYLDLKRYEEAETWYGKALEVDPDYGYAHNGLGLLRKAQDQVEKAEAAFKRAMEADPKEPIYPYNLGDMYRDLKRYEEAETWYGKALEVDPDYGSAHNGLGLLRKAQDQVEKAEAAFKRAMEVGIDKLVYASNLGDLYASIGQRDKSVEAFERMLKTGIDKAGTLNNYAWMLHTKFDDATSAEPLACQAVDLDPSPEHWHTLADIQLALSEWSHGADSVVQLIRSSQPSFLHTYRQDVVLTFRRILKMGHGHDLIAILREFGGEHWLPWREAIERVSNRDVQEGPTDEVSKIIKELTSESLPCD